VLVTADVTRFVRVRVTAVNAKGSVDALSDPTAAVVAPSGKPTLVTSPEISGPARVGSTLSASTGTWTGGAPMTFKIEWATCAPSSNTCYYNGATGSTFTTPAGTPVGTRVVVVVSAQNSAGVSYGQSRTTEPLAAR
jgi:hypothetical protein